MIIKKLVFLGDENTITATPNSYVTYDIFKQFNSDGEDTFLVIKNGTPISYPIANKQEAIDTANDDFQSTVKMFLDSIIFDLKFEKVTDKVGMWKANGFRKFQITQDGNKFSTVIETQFAFVFNEFYSFSIAVAFCELYNKPIIDENRLVSSYQYIVKELTINEVNQQIILSGFCGFKIDLKLDKNEAATYRYFLYDASEKELGKFETKEQAIVFANILNIDLFKNHFEKEKNV